MKTEFDKHLTEGGLYVAEGAMYQHLSGRWYIFAADDRGRSTTIACVDHLPMSRDTIVTRSLPLGWMDDGGTGVRIAIDWDPEKTTLVP